MMDRRINKDAKLTLKEQFRKENTIAEGKNIRVIRVLASAAHILKLE